MDEAEKRKCMAIEIARSINPEAELLYTTNKPASGINKERLCNGLSLNECRNLCAAADDEFTREGNLEAARVVHEIPLFVFAMLSKDEIKEFVFVWMNKNKGC